MDRAVPSAVDRLSDHLHIYRDISDVGPVPSPGAEVRKLRTVSDGPSRIGLTMGGAQALRPYLQACPANIYD